MDDSIDFVQTIHKHALNSPTATVFHVPADGCPAQWLPCSWQLLDTLIASLILRWRSLFAQARKAQVKPVAAILVNPPEDFMPPALVLTALGFTLMPVNPFLPPKQIATLLGVANCSFFVCGSAQVADDILSNMPKGSLMHVLAPEERLHCVVNSPQLSTALIKAPYIVPITEPVRGYLLHSTGSTGLPKLVPWRHSAMVAQIKPNLEGGFMSADGPVDRTMFITRDLFAVIPIGITLKSLYLGPGWKIAFPTFHTVEHTVVDILDDLLALEKCTDLSLYTADISSILNFLDPQCPNSQLDTVEERDRKLLYINKLASFHSVPTGGSKVLDHTMAQAIRLGVRVQVTYGTTESGACLASDPSLIPEEDWGRAHDGEKMQNLVRLGLAVRKIPFYKVYFCPVGSSELDKCASPVTPMDSEPLYELEIDATQDVFSSPTSANDTSGTRWKTRDLFRLVEHNGQELWIYHTRMDDMLMLGNGGAVYPAKIEDKIYKAVENTALDGRVQVLLVGSSKPVPSLLVEFQPPNTPISSPALSNNDPLPTPPPSAQFDTQQHLLPSPSRLSPYPASPRKAYFPNMNKVNEHDGQFQLPCDGNLSDEESEFAKGLFIDAFSNASKDINASFPVYSQLTADMIYFLAPHERLARTIKENVNRKKSEARFSASLEQLYAKRTAASESQALSASQSLSASQATIRNKSLNGRVTLTMSTTNGPTTISTNNSDSTSS